MLSAGVVDSWVGVVPLFLILSPVTPNLTEQR